MTELDRIFQGQAYRVIGKKAYVRQDESRTRLICWQSHCAQCGEAFTFWTPAQAKKFSPNRRCEAHKQPGVRVAPRFKRFSNDSTGF